MLVSNAVAMSGPVYLPYDTHGMLSKYTGFIKTLWDKPLNVPYTISILNLQLEHIVGRNCFFNWYHSSIFLKPEMLLGFLCLEIWAEIELG